MGRREGAVQVGAERRRPQSAVGRRLYSLRGLAAQPGGGSLRLCALSLSPAPDCAGRGAPSAALLWFLRQPKMREQSPAPFGG